MTDLVMMQHGEPVTTSLAIAEGIEQSHNSVIKLVRRYIEDLQEFGPCGFEIHMAKREQGGGKPIEYAILNEPQSTLLLTYMRNSEVVRGFKKALVRAFFDMRDQLYQSDTSNLANHHPQSQADTLINAGRIFREVTRLVGIANKAKPETLTLANAATAEVTGLDLLALLERNCWQPPALQHKAELEAVTRQLRDWLEEQGGSEYSSEQLMAVLGITDPSNADYTILAIAMRSLGWLAQG